MNSLLARKPIAVHEESANGLRRVLGAGDLVMLAIGAVIGAGIFSSIGTAAAGEVRATGEVIRYGAGPALVISFLLLGFVCGLAALCYAELASMIPQAGSAYAYSYATLGELIAWIIGWDLILEYAVGNVAVAVLLSADPAVSGLLATAPRVFGIPVLLNLPAFGIVALITWLLLRGVKESARANNIMVVVKLLVLGLFVVVGGLHIDTANYVPFAPNGWRGIHQGAAIVFFAYIGFDAISTAAEETKNPQRNLPIGILGGLALCTLIYVIVGFVATGLVPYEQLRAADPLAKALDVAGLQTASWIVSFGAVVSLSAVLLVFQYGQPRIFYAMARDGLLPPWAAKIHPNTHPAHHDDDHRRRRRARRAGGRRERDLRSHQHRHAVRLRDRLRRRAGAPLQGPRPAAPLPRALRVAGDPWRHGGVPVHHARAPHQGVGAVRLVAGDRARALLRLRIPSFHSAPRRRGPSSLPLTR